MSFTYSKGSCKLNQPIQIGNKTIHERHWIEVSDGKIKVDLAPLPGLHSESLEESFLDFKNKIYQTPSALFVKECFEIFTSVQQIETSSNKLLYIDLNNNPSELALSLDKNSIYKVKIGRNDLELESKWLKALVTSLPIDTKLRLDGNRSFSVDQLNKYLDQLQLKKIQYLEEPLKNVTDWTLLNRCSELSLALDESIGQRRHLNYAKYIVAKPSFNISLKDTLKELAVENQEVIISNAFDPPNNIAILKMVASESDQICGLDTLKYFDLTSLTNTPA